MRCRRQSARRQRQRHNKGRIGLAIMNNVKGCGGREQCRTGTGTGAAGGNVSGCQRSSFIGAKVRRIIADQQLAAPAIKKNGNAGKARPLRKRLRRDQRRAGKAEHRHSPRQPKRARCGNADADAGEAARADVDEHGISGCAADQRGNAWHQCFGMAAPYDAVVVRGKSVAIEPR